jgi:transposase-like protein
MISESIRRRGIIVGEVSYGGHRYPAEIIAHCVWLYHRFPLSFREVEELMLVRGVIVSQGSGVVDFRCRDLQRWV